MSDNNTQLQAEISQALMNQMKAAVSTAREFPRRPISVIKQDCVTVIENDLETAESMMYCFPRKEKQEDGSKKDKDIKGPTIRMAELILSKYGNIYVSDHQVVEHGDYVEAFCYAWDMETNNVMNTRYPIKITDRNGRRYFSDLVDLFKRSAMAKARRNAIFTIIPSEIIEACKKAAENTVKKAAQGGPKESPQAKETRERKITGVRDAIGLSDEQLFSVLDVNHFDDIVGDAYLRLVQLYKAFEDGMSKEAILSKDQLSDEKVAKSFDLSKYVE
jgi:hypothetical protein